MDPPQEKVIVTGSRKGLGDQSESSTSVAPQAIVLTKEDINFISTPHVYLSSDAVDAGLCLLDRKLNEESDLDVVVYTTQNLRLIFHGDNSLVKSGKFVTIIPRSFGISEEGARYAAMKAGHIENEPGGHFTLISNLHCQQGEVNIYETYGPYRTAESLLTPNGRTLLNILCNSEASTLKVNCINVAKQEESECGAISVALGVNLCFFAPSENAIFKRISNVRETYLDCMKRNSLTYFKMSPRMINDDFKVLFSINI